MTGLLTEREVADLLKCKPHQVRPAAYVRNSPVIGWQVYVVEATGLDHFKIGFTKDFRYRLENLSIGCPVPLVHRWSLPCDSKDMAERLEKIVHQVLGYNRARGEWFHFRPETRSKQFIRPDLLYAAKLVRGLVQ